MEGYPVVLLLSEKPCLLVGGGMVATRKARRLLEAGAKITVIAPEITTELMTLVHQGKIVWEKRSYQKGDVEGFFLVFAASGNPSTNREIAEEAKMQGILCDVVDCAACSSFFTPAILEWEGFLIAITSGGKSPFMVRLLREWLKTYLPQNFGRVLEFMEKNRQEIKRLHIPLAEKKRRYRELFEEWYMNQKGEEL